jgi:hypothetical protein
LPFDAWPDHGSQISVKLNLGAFRAAQLDQSGSFGAYDLIADFERLAEQGWLCLGSA